MKQDTIGTAGESNESSPVLNRRVLVVDDDKPMRAAFKEMLQEWSFAPSLVATFREARDAVVTEEPFAVIVSDYHLPDGTGLELLDWLYREMGLQVPFLLISGGLTRTPSAAYDYDFLAKPFLMEKFRQRLEKLCRVKPQPDASFNLTVAQEAMASVYASRRPPKNK